MSVMNGLASTGGVPGMSPDAITAAINAAVARVLPAELVPAAAAAARGGR